MELIMGLKSYRAVLGFAFYKEHVYLLDKNRGPDSVVGKFNGLGGKLKDGESWEEAMSREFKEEGGPFTYHDQWRHFCSLYGDWGKVRCYATLLLDRQNDDMMTGDLSLTSERVGLFDPLELPNRVVSNLRWLIPMAMDDTIASHTRVRLN